MFAYYAKLCWTDDNFWHDFNRDSIYWRVFREFVEQMLDLEERNMTSPQTKNSVSKFKQVGIYDLNNIAIDLPCE